VKNICYGDRKKNFPVQLFLFPSNCNNLQFHGKNSRQRNFSPQDQRAGGRGSFFFKKKCSKYNSSLSSLSFYLVGIHVYTRNLSKKKKQQNYYYYIRVFVVVVGDFPSTFFFLPSSLGVHLVCSRLEDPKVVTVANDGCDGGDSSDVDENLEKVASQLALTAFAWWTWP